nr:muscle-specific protein 300 kDa-like [Lytechinus pictus]
MDSWSRFKAHEAELKNWLTLAEKELQVRQGTPRQQMEKHKVMFEDAEPQVMTKFLEVCQTLFHALPADNRKEVETRMNILQERYQTVHKEAQRRANELQFEDVCIQLKDQFDAAEKQLDLEKQA